MDKDRITRQSEHKGRQTNNSSLVSKQISLYSNIGNIKKRKNVLSPVRSKNSPLKSKDIQVKQKVSESKNNKRIKKNTTIDGLNPDGLKTPPVQSITLSSIKSRFKNDQMHQSQNNSDEDDDVEESSVSSNDSSKGTSTEKNDAPSPAAIEETKILKALESDSDTSTIIHNKQLNYMKTKFESALSNNQGNYPVKFGEHSDAESESNQIKASTIIHNEQVNYIKTKFESALSNNPANYPVKFEEHSDAESESNQIKASTIIHNKQVNYIKTKFESALSNNPSNYPVKFGEHSDAESESNQIKAVIKGYVSKKINFDNLEEQNNKKGMKDGHYNMLHTYVRDELFKKIKILSDAHLLENGQIMNKCLEQCKYNPNKHDVKFINDCRTEIRITINSRRGYVKRKIKILLQGKLLLFFGYWKTIGNLHHCSFLYSCTNYTKK
jgi:hypothetical protein